MSYAEKKQEVDLLQQQIRTHGILSDEIKRKINYKYRLEWNYYSNSMEGNTLTKEETRSVMVGNLTVGGKPIKDVFEMKGHDEVIAEILKIGKGDLRLSEKRIREIHSGIMHEEDEAQKSKIGSWKTEPNYVLNYKKERFDFTLPVEVPEKMHQLLNKTNAAIDAIEQNKKDALHPVDIALQFHLDFVLIHPFYDGNGRTARILTNLLLISFGYPPFWIKTAERDIYNQYIADIQGYGGKPDLFFEFAAGLIMRSQQLVLDAIEGREIEEMDDIDKEMTLLKAELSGENVLNQQATSENICDAVEINIIPIFSLIEEKCEPLKEFFFTTNRRIVFTLAGEDVDKMVGTKDSKWEELKQNWLGKQIREEGKMIRSIRYSFELKGFKKRVTANSFWATVEIFFGEYNYSIKVERNRNQPAQIPYGKVLNNEALRQFVSPIVKDVIEDIKRLKGYNTN